MSLPEQQAKTREFCFQGLACWKLSEMVALLPLLIQLSLLLFSIGLILFLFHVNTLSFGIVVAVLGIVVMFYGVTTTISVVATLSPFRSPISHAFGPLYQRFHAGICPRIDYFFSPDMDVVPLGFYEKVLVKVQLYPEEKFKKPFADNPADSMNLTIARNG